MKSALSCVFFELGEIKRRFFFSFKFRKPIKIHSIKSKSGMRDATDMLYDG